MRRVTRVLALALLLLAHGTVARAAVATVVGLGQGRSVTGTINAMPRSFGFAGTINVTIDGGPLTPTYCLEALLGVIGGEMLPQVPPTYACEVGHILANFYPNAPAVLSTSREAAAVQSAIWFFTDQFAVTSPSDVVTRAQAIIAAAQAQCVNPMPPVIPQAVAVTSDALPGNTMRAVTATVTDGSAQPLANLSIEIVVTGVSGPQTFQGTTNAQGQIVVNYTNTFAVSGIDTITATLTFSTLSGLKFKAPEVQALGTAGMVTATISATTSVSWVPSSCGNGLVDQTGEECDDGNVTNGDGCDTNCTATRCGNGVPTAGEQCDDGNPTNGDGCDVGCLLSSCGNGVVGGLEQCDDANQTNGDGCDTNCTATACGNGVQTAGEQCDDGNQTNGDTCDVNCTVPACGNGIVAGNEQCDDGNTNSGDGCDANCTIPNCGNGMVGAGEQCDDGNPTNGDGCDVNCTTSACGNGIVAGNEQCDDGNAIDADGCEANCTLPVCGNGIVDPNEQCDDGNIADGDGCSAICRTSEMCTNLLDDDGDGLIDCEDPECDDDCGVIGRDPAKIQLRNGIDRFSFHGIIDVPLDVDPAQEELRIRLSNDAGELYRGILPAGALVARGTSAPSQWRYLDTRAASGAGAFDGIFKVRLRRDLRRGGITIEFKCYAPLDAATLPTMTLQAQVGPSAFILRATWAATRNGWLLDF